MAEEEQDDIKTKQDFEEAREDAETPGKLPGEDNAPAEATPGGGGDTDSAAIGDGPSGGADTGGGVEGDSAATGTTPTEGGGTGVGEGGGG